MNLQKVAPSKEILLFIKKKIAYRTNSFRGNYCFLNLTLVHTGAETIPGRKLFKGGNYSRKYGTYFKPLSPKKGMQNDKKCFIPRAGLP